MYSRRLIIDIIQYIILVFGNRLNSSLELLYAFVVLVQQFLDLTHQSRLYARVENFSITVLVTNKIYLEKVLLSKESVLPAISFHYTSLQIFDLIHDCFVCILQLLLLCVFFFYGSNQ